MNTNIDFNNSINKLTKDEQYALTYLESINYEWRDAFMKALLISRDKISQRLITSLHRENLVNSRDYSQVITTHDAPINLATNQLQTLKINFPHAQKTLYAPITGLHAFDRIDVEGPFYFESKHNLERILHPNEILSCILTEVPTLNNDASYQFREDINNSVANMAISLSFQMITLADETLPLGQLIIEAEDSYLRSEQAVVEGHPLHPGAKLRKGMTPETTINYSSEFNNVIGLKFILIHKDIAKVETLSKNYNETLYDLFEGLYSEVLREVGSEHIDTYYVMVIHPWQYNEVLINQYDNELKEKRIIPIHYQLDYHAGLSFRTLMPKLPITSPHIKLSTNVHITGEIRTLSEQTTINGPQITKILNDIKHSDTLFHNIAGDTIDEIAGIHFFKTEDPHDIQTIRSEQLGSLFRTNIYDIIDNNTTPMIPSSLVANYVYNYETPINTLIKKYAQTHAFVSYKEACITWIEQYSQALIDITLPLYIKYGIALEAHLQNTIATFNSDGSLNKLYVRDFEGLRIDEVYLNHMGYRTQNFHEKSLILTNQPQTVFNKVFYSSIQNHLGELICTLAKSSAIDDLEQSIWSNVSDLLANKLNVIANTMDDSKRIDEIRALLFASEIDYKCVTTMRLEDEADVYTYIKVNNPLHRNHESH